MARLIPRLGAEDSAIQKMCSGESWLSMEKFFFQSAASEYCPERMTLSARWAASTHLAGPRVTAPLAFTVAVYTWALRYRLARIAFAAPLVMRPRYSAGQDTGSPPAAV